MADVKNKKILIVEDEQYQQLLYQEELEDEGYTVDVASTGKKGLEMLDKNTYDLVVMDIRMPDMDGIEALGHMASQKSTVPVVIHSAYSNFKENYTTWSADAYIVKSSDLEPLKKKIAELLEKKK